MQWQTLSTPQKMALMGKYDALDMVVVAVVVVMMMMIMTMVLF